MMFRKQLSALFICFYLFCLAQNESRLVNVFLGTSGDHGQMSPAASYPFGMLSIGPQTYPNLHAGYEFKAKKFLGFTHTRIEGVGCMGSGGNFLLKPILNSDTNTELIKVSDEGSPGYYKVSFNNGINVRTTVFDNHGQYDIVFPKNSKPGFHLNLGFAAVKRFVAASYKISGAEVTGFADTKSTCDQGKYRIYFCFQFPKGAKVKTVSENELLVEDCPEHSVVNVGISSVDENYARARITNEDFDTLKKQSEQKWDELLGTVKVEGSKENTDLFYSLFYRTLQSPFKISEPDGSYRATDGSLQKSSSTMYHGWAIWDNFRDQLPLISIIFPDLYKDFALSIADIYRFGKSQWATEHSPSPTVRTEHAVGVLLDAINKGIPVPYKDILPEIKKDVDAWQPTSPDKILEASYDYWAASEIFKKAGDLKLSAEYLSKSKLYRESWTKTFGDITRPEMDKMGAAGIYQGTLWQYRWLLPHDIGGLKKMVGGDEELIRQLDVFFDEDYYNHANETDTQASSIYNATSQPWKAQRLIRRLLVGDDVIQYYFNDNSRGIDPYIGRIYKNQPEAYLRTMDDDAGAMSAWWVMRSLGFSVVNVGQPIFYLNAPLFTHYQIKRKDGTSVNVSADSSDKYYYIEDLKIDGRTSSLNYMDYNDLKHSKQITFHLSEHHSKTFGIKNQVVTELK